MNKPQKIFLSEHQNHGKREDLKQIKQYLGTITPETKVGIIYKKMNFVRRKLHKNCTIISITPWENTAPDGSTVYAGKNMTKAEECQCLDEHNIPVPRWHLWQGGSELPQKIGSWGDYVVRKPNLGSRGAEVKIVKRSRLKWKNLEVKYRGISSEPFLQEFIHTGPYPVSYRVGSFFGDPLYSFKIEAPGNSLPLLSKNGFGDAKDQGISRIVANTKRSNYTLCFDEDILDLARRAHQAFPKIPMLGVDIIKDYETGELWVVEVNASGFTWHLSSEAGRKIQKKHGLDLLAQFGGLKRAAEIIAERFGAFKPS